VTNKFGRYWTGVVFAYEGGDAAWFDAQVSTLKDFSVLNLLASDAGENHCKSGNESRGNGSNQCREKVGVAKGFSGLSEQDQVYVIRGAIVLITICSVLAYFVLNRKSV
jgi:hypothetical protein